jgi:hypothetical protein
LQAGRDRDAAADDRAELIKSLRFAVERLRVAADERDSGALGPHGLRKRPNWRRQGPRRSRGRSAARSHAVTDRGRPAPPARRMPPVRGWLALRIAARARSCSRSKSVAVSSAMAIVIARP